MSDITNSDTELSPQSQNGYTTNVNVDKLAMMEKHDHYHEAGIDINAIEVLHQINPKYVDRYFDLVEKGMELETTESARDNETLNKALDNDRAVIDLNGEKIRRGQRSAFWIAIILSFLATILGLNDQEELAGIMLGTVVALALKYFLGGKKDQKNTKDSKE